MKIDRAAYTENSVASGSKICPCDVFCLECNAIHNGRHCFQNSVNLYRPFERKLLKPLLKKEKITDQYATFSLLPLMLLTFSMGNVSSFCV